MRNEPVTTERIDNYEIEIYQDESPESPRRWDNLGTMICFHRRYNLGDKGNFFDPEDFNSWKEQRKWIEKSIKPYVILPLYLYDHSGITISTSPFGCIWDSGQVGWIWVTKEKIKEEYGVKYITKEIIRKVTDCLESEVKTYDEYLRGDVYGYKVFKVSECSLGHEHREELDSCWGFYGEEHCMDEAKGIVSYYNKKEKVM